MVRRKRRIGGDKREDCEEREREGRQERSRQREKARRKS
jgi:hypothetical protein